MPTGAPTRLAARTGSRTRTREEEVPEQPKRENLDDERRRDETAVAAIVHSIASSTRDIAGVSSTSLIGLGG